MSEVPVEDRTSLLSDNGSGYVSQAFGDYLRLVGIKHILTSPFHLQTNGKVERYQQTLKGEVNQMPYEMPSGLKQAIASTGVTSLHTSTASFSRMVVVNGPIRHEIGMNAGIGALGPFNHANAIIGRAWTILSKNLSGSGIPGENYVASLGCNMNYNNFYFPEKEEALPSGWNPLHVQKGFQPEDSVVSILTGYSMLRADSSFIGTLYTQLPYYLSNCNPTAGACMLLDPTVAHKLKDEGFNTKEELIQWAWDNTKIKVDDYWNKYHFTQNFTLPLAEKGVEPYASWLELPEDSLIPQFSGTHKINIIVVGGETNLFWKLGDHTYVTSASVDKWR